MRNAIRFIAAAAACLAIFCSAATAAIAAPAQKLTVTSPDGKLQLSFALKSLPYASGERAYYRVSYAGQAVLADSPLGIEFEDAPSLDHGFVIESTS
ncbi:MAG: glycoside hydrolase family 97 N-terminal domain-containing protein, partial [Terriglobia bacterium]